MSIGVDRQFTCRFALQTGIAYVLRRDPSRAVPLLEQARDLAEDPVLGDALKAALADISAGGTGLGPLMAGQYVPFDSPWLEKLSGFADAGGPGVDWSAYEAKIPEIAKGQALTEKRLRRNLLQLYRATGRDDDYRRLGEIYLRGYPEDREILLFYAQVLRIGGDPAACNEIIDKLITDVPEMPVYRIVAGVNALNDGETESALAALQSARAIIDAREDPAQFTALLGWIGLHEARAAAQQGDFTAALGKVEQVVTDSGLAPCWIEGTRALCLAYGGDAEGSTAAARRALAAQPPTLWTRIGWGLLPARFEALTGVNPDGTAA
ncbi:MAG: hypothetical protein ACPGO3_07870 [Magnetospiraceae bacterium]